MQVSRIEYKGYVIWQNVKEIPRHNPISGHHWSDQKIIKGYYIAGKKASVLDTFPNIKKAKEHIDFLIFASSQNTI